MSVSRMAMAMANYFMKSSVVSDVFIVIFTSLAHFRLVIAKVIPIAGQHCKVILVHTTFACLHALVQLWNISHRPLQIFVQLEQCAPYQVSRWILSRQHVPNKQCALDNNVRLITRFYGM